MDSFDRARDENVGPEYEWQGYIPFELCKNEWEHREQEWQEKLDQCFRTFSSPPKHLFTYDNINNQSRRRATKDDDEDTDSGGGDNDGGDKTYKICSVPGGMDMTRFISQDARHFFAGAIEDVELIREVISTTADHGGVGHRMTLAELNSTLDRVGRGYCDDEATCNSTVQTTLEAGLQYVDDRPDREIDFYIGTYGLINDLNSVAELAIVQAAELVFPWIVDRKARPNLWSSSHQNGRSTGPHKEPFRFSSLYSAAWIGSYGEAWLHSC